MSTTIPPLPRAPETGPVQSRSHQRMNALRRKPLLRKTVATGLFVFGTVAIIFPLLPGWPLIGVGLYLLSIDSPEIQDRIHRYRMKHSALDKVLKHSYDKLNERYFPSDSV